MKLAFALVLTAGITQAGITYQVVDLGASGPLAAAWSINNSGTAAGWYQDVHGIDHAFTSSGHGAAEIGGSARAYGLNNTGQVVGDSEASSSQAVAWQGSVASVLSGPDSYALAVNDAGEVAGAAGGVATVFRAGGAEALGFLPGGSWSAAYGIDSSGAVAGYGDTADGSFHAFVWTAGGGIIDLGTFGGANSYGMGINTSGAIVGGAQGANGCLHAFLYQGGFLRDLGTLGGCNSAAYGINASGSVVGYSWTAGGADTHAFLYQTGQLIDLNSRLQPSGTAWLISAAYSINDAGQIVGTGILDGQQHAIRLDPICNPEPGTLVLMCGGGGLLWVLRIFRRSRAARRAA